MKIKTLFAVLLIAVLLLSPAALMEEVSEPQDVVSEEAAPVVDEPEADADQPDTEDVAQSEIEDIAELDQEIVSEPVDAVVEEIEEADLPNLPMLEAQSDEDELDLGFLEEIQEEGLQAEAGLILAEANYDVLSNSTTFNVQGKTISASMVANQNNCWTYASLIYQKIWNTSFSSDFVGSASAGWNSLRELSDANRTVTVDHLKAYIGNAQLGATLRICGCTSACSSWGNDSLACGHHGHSMIIVQKDANGFTTVENSRPSSNAAYAVWTRYYTWQGFVNYWGSNYPYIKYIKWPNAPVYDGSVVSDNTFLKDPIIYNAEYYRKKYPDLQKAFGNDNNALLQHWLTTGSKEGRVASPVFYARYYINKYDDLSKAFGTDYQAAIQHFVTYGIKEGRTASEEFSANIYIQNYLDMQKDLGGDKYHCALHYINFGKKEGRIANKRLRIQFNPGNGTVSPQSKEVTNFASYGSLPVPTYSNHVFLGWYTKSNGGNIVNSNSIVDIHSVPTLYAHWEQKNTSSSSTSTSTSVTSSSLVISKAPASVKVKAGKKGKVMLSWKKIKNNKKNKALLKQIKGIEIQVSTDPTFATNVQSANLGKNKTKVIIKGLQKKTVYYFRVRYTDGTGGVSNWSNTKKVKTKK